MKRILIIAYYWPPAGGPGVQRWLKFVKYIREFGIEPVVYVPKNPHYPMTDEGLVDEIPAGLDIIRQPIREPYRWARLFSKGKTKQLSSGIIPEKKSSFIEQLLVYIRGNFFIPDARIGWVKPSVAYLIDYLDKNPVDGIVTTGPPHSLHLIGQQLKQRMNVFWLADFRDPWTSIHYHSKLNLSKAARSKHKQLEATVINSADRIVVTSPGTKSEFEGITQKPISVITNGFDTTDIPEGVVVDAEFSLVHIGSLLSKRNPVVLWKVLAELINESEEFAASFKLRLIGAVSESVLETITSHGLSSYCETPGYISHSAALYEQQKAQLLLLIETDEPETRKIIPGKLFEYMASRRPILAIGPTESDMEAILMESGSGSFYGYTDKDQIRDFIWNKFEQFLTGGLPDNTSQTKRFSRRELTRQMAELLTKQ